MYDIAVLGGGPGGYVAAIAGAQNGLKVLLIEKDRIGGTCLNSGCIPTKSFLSDVKLRDMSRTSRVLVNNENLDIDIPEMVKRKNRVVDIQVRGLTAVIRDRGIRIEQGKGKISGLGSVTVNKKDGSAEEFKARNIILATGSNIAIPPSIQTDGHSIITTDEALNPETLPRSMAIIGGGAVGVEFAAIYGTLGTKVTILEMLPDIIMGEDEDVRNSLKTLLQNRGVQIKLKAEVVSMDRQGDHVVVTFKDQFGNMRDIKTEKVLVATGRKPNLEGIDAAKIGLVRNGQFVRVNEKMETGVAGIYAIGDLVGGWMLAHAASAEGEVAVGNILGERRSMNQNRVPRCIYTFPEVASVGMTEQQAGETGLQIQIGKYEYKFSGKAHAMNEAEGFVKIIGNALTGEILGASILGEHATDLIGEIQLAMNVEAAVEDLWDVIKAHPSLGECVREAALDWAGKAVHCPPNPGNR